MLSDNDIRDILGALHFVTSYAKEPFRPEEQIQPCSVDLRLDNVFWLPRWRQPIDLRRARLLEMEPRRYYKRVTLQPGEYLVVRPRQLVQFDDPGTAPIFDQLVDITGAERVAWSTQGECCASPIWGINDDLSLELTGKKLADAKESGAEYLCVACPFCQLQFDRVQRLGLAKGNGDNRLPSLIFTQLLGLSLGVDQTALGIQKNELDASGIMNFLSQKPVPQPPE